LGKVQEIVVPFEVLPPIPEALAAKGRFIQLSLLDHGPHGTVENDDPPL